MPQTRISLTTKVRQALIKAEEVSGKCLSSDNFYLVASINYYPILGFETLVNKEALWLTIVERQHVELNDGFILAINTFNKEMQDDWQESYLVP